MSYYAARMSFVKRSLNFFTEEATKEPAILLAERAIISAPEHVEVPNVPQQKRYVKGIIDFYIADVLKTEDDRLIAFRIGKKRYQTRGTLSDRKFGEVEDEHYPSSNVMWSAKNQIIFIENPKKDRMSVKSIINNLQSYLNNRLAGYGYIVLIAQLPHKASFWRSIEKYDKKYSVEFILFAPNFLDAGSNIRELTESTEREFGANKTSIKFVSEKGSLLIRKGMKFIEDCVAWIESGAGKWIIRVGLDKKKKSISSESESKFFDRDLTEYNSDAARAFTDKANESIKDEEKQENKGTIDE